MSDKPCTKCAFFYEDIWSGYRCHRVKVSDPVRGSVYLSPRCRTERGIISKWLGGCGPDGKFWERRKSIQEKLDEADAALAIEQQKKIYQLQIAAAQYASGCALK